MTPFKYIKIYLFDSITTLPIVPKIEDYESGLFGKADELLNSTSRRFLRGSLICLIILSKAFKRNVLTSCPLNPSFWVLLGKWR